MSDAFPRTQIEDVSVSRMLIGINWFMGFCHQTKARETFVKKHMNPGRIADICEVFLAHGIDTLYGTNVGWPTLQEGIRETEQRTGRRLITMGTPHLELGDTAEARDANARILDEFVEMGATVCLPHQCVTDAALCRRTRSLPGMETLCAMIRERGMIPGLSTHMPETPVYADASGLDVATYVQPYNPRGFLMQIEIDWVHRMIWEAKNPVIAIKTMAAGRIDPLVGMAFAWSTIRERDMVCVGTMTPDEARELIDITRGILERTGPSGELQKTRSKESLVRGTARDQLPAGADAE
jgi:hypothetical protein